MTRFTRSAGRPLPILAAAIAAGGLHGLPAAGDGRRPGRHPPFADRRHGWRRRHVTPPRRDARDPGDQRRRRRPRQAHRRDRRGCQVRIHHDVSGEGEEASRGRQGRRRLRVPYVRQSEKRAADLREVRRPAFLSGQLRGERVLEKRRLPGVRLPTQQLLPTLDWLASAKGGSRKSFYLIGTDYVFPRTTNLIATRHVEFRKEDRRAEKYVPFGHRDFEASGRGHRVQRTGRGRQHDMSLFRHAEADSRFLDAATRQQGRPRQDAARLSRSQRGRPVADGCGPREGDPGRPDVLPDRSFAGEPQVPGTGQGESSARTRSSPIRMVNAYEGVHLLEAGRREGEVVRRLQGAARRSAKSSSTAPPAKSASSAKTLHAKRPLLIGKARDDRQFDIIHATEPIEGDPYPQETFAGWRCDWTAGRAFASQQEVTRLSARSCVSSFLDGRRPISLEEPRQRFRSARSLPPVWQAGEDSNSSRCRHSGCAGRSCRTPGTARRICRGPPSPCGTR